MELHTDSVIACRGAFITGIGFGGSDNVVAWGLYIISMIAATENLHRHLQFRVSGSEGVKTGFVPGLHEFYRG